MRRADEILQTEQRTVFQSGRLDGEDIEGGPADLAVDQGLIEGLLVTDSAAGAVDEHRVLLHRREKLGGEQVLGLLGQRHMDGDEIGPPGQFQQIDQFHPDLFRHLPGQMRIIGDGLHLQALSPVGGNPADPADTDDTQGLAGQLPPHEALFLPLSFLHRGGCLRDIAGQGHHHRDRMFRRGGGIAIRGVHDHNPLLAGGRDIDVVQADAGPPDNLQFVGRLEQVGGHLGGAADHQALIIADDLFQLLGFQACIDIDLKPGLFKYLHARRRQIVADQYLHLRSLSCNIVSLCPCPEQSAVFIKQVNVHIVFIRYIHL